MSARCPGSIRMAFRATTASLRCCASWVRCTASWRNWRLGWRALPRNRCASARPRRNRRVQLSTRGRYAVMAMVDLAMQQTLGCECGPVCLAEIANRQKLSQAYLEQLFGKLRRAGLVASARGPGGGYRLARSSPELAIADSSAA